MASTIRDTLHGTAADGQSEGLPSQLRQLWRSATIRWQVPLRILVTAVLGSFVAIALMVANWIGLVPDSRMMRGEARTSLAEVVAAGSMGALAANDTKTVRELLQFAIDRNPGLKSAGIRRAEALLVEAGPHAGQWLPMAAGRSADAQLLVPLYVSNERWGQLEMRFDATEDAWWRNPTWLLITLVALSCCIGFYLYLGRILRPLDPSRAVPDRVRGALDTLAEELLLIDAQGDIVLANLAFCELLGQPAEALASQSASGLAWTDAEGRPIDSALLPWVVAQSSGRTLKKQLISIVGADGVRRDFLANCAPVGADADTPPAGVMVSFNDITAVRLPDVAPATPAAASFDEGCIPPKKSVSGHDAQTAMQRRSSSLTLQGSLKISRGTYSLGAPEDLDFEIGSRDSLATLSFSGMPADVAAALVSALARSDTDRKSQ